MAIKIQAATRLKATKKTRKRKLRAKKEEIDPSSIQNIIDLIAPSVFSYAEPYKDLTQRDKVRLRLPFPYTDVWKVGRGAQTMLVSISAFTGQLWCCAFRKEHELDLSSTYSRPFVQDVFFTDKPLKESIAEAFSQVRPRIIRWLHSLGER